MVSDCSTTSPSNDCFVHRITGLPLVNDALLKVMSSYETTKQYAPLLQSTLNTVERSVQYATEKAKPMYEEYLQDSVVMASKVACKGLDRIEETYPAIRMTPDQLREVSQEYYQKSYMKQGVDTVVATRDYGVDKVDQTRAYYNQVLGSLFDYGTSVLGGSLDYCDDLIDKYVAEGTTKEEETADSYVKRLQTMGGKMASGLSVKAERQAANTKVAIQKAVADFRGAMVLIDYVKSTRDWAGQSTSHLMGNVATLKDNLEKQAKQYNVQPEVLLLRWVKLSAGMLSTASDQMLKRTVVYLPETAKNSLEATSTYLHYLDQSFAEVGARLEKQRPKAKSLADVKDELLSEAKDKLATVEQGLVNVLDRFSDYPPLSWMCIDFDGIELQENEELLPNLIFNPPPQRQRYQSG